MWSSVSCWKIRPLLRWFLSFAGHVWLPCLTAGRYIVYWPQVVRSQNSVRQNPIVPVLMLSFLPTHCNEFEDSNTPSWISPLSHILNFRYQACALDHPFSNFWMVLFHLFRGSFRQIHIQIHLCVYIYIERERYKYRYIYFYVHKIMPINHSYNVCLYNEIFHIAKNLLGLYIHMYTHTHIHIHTDIYTYIYIYIQIHIHTYTHIHRHPSIHT